MNAKRTLFIVRDLAGAEPLGLMYIAAILRQAGHDIRFAGGRGVDLSAEVRDFSPQIIGYSVCTGQHTWYLALNRFLKQQFRFLSLFGGPHPTFFPEMIEEEGVDIICRGEGELASLDLCNALAGGRPITEIANLWVKDKGHIHRNPVRPLLADLDHLPFPDREALGKADPGGRDYPARSFMTSRGCPYQCAYCFNPAMKQLYGSAWGKRRLRSPENVVREIDSVHEGKRLRFVQFRCSFMPTRQEWLAEFAELYRRRIGLPFYCHVRADLMTDKAVALLARAGCRSVNMGLECADERYRREVLHRPMSNDTIRMACHRLHKHGIAILADNMLGLPGQTFADNLDTLRFNAECEIDYPLAMMYQPYPGTELGRHCQQHGYFDEDYSSINYNYYYGSPLKFKNAGEKRRIENLHKLFAIAADVPWMLPLVKRLVKYPPNTIFNAIFRCWYAFCYHTRIMPYRLRWEEIQEILEVLFGIYRKESFREARIKN